MKTAFDLPRLLEGFFTERLMQQKQASPHTIASYRDTFRYLLRFTEKRLRKPPSRLTLKDIDAPLIAAFLNDLEKSRSISRCISSVSIPHEPHTSCRVAGRRKGVTQSNAEWIA